MKVYCGIDMKALCQGLGRPDVFDSLVTRVALSGANPDKLVPWWTQQVNDLVRSTEFEGEFCRTNPSVTHLLWLDHGVAGVSYPQLLALHGCSEQFSDVGLNVLWDVSNYTRPSLDRYAGPFLSNQLNKGYPFVLVDCVMSVVMDFGRNKLTFVNRLVHNQGFDLSSGA